MVRRGAGRDGKLLRRMREDPVTHETIIDQVTGKAIDHHFCATAPRPRPDRAPAGTEPGSVHKVSVVRVTSTGVGPCPGCG